VSQKNIFVSGVQCEQLEGPNVPTTQLTNRL